MLSGYGLAYSMENKKDYLKGFLKQRLVKILAPAYIVFVIQTLGLCLINDKYSLVEGGQILDVKLFFNATNWYVWECIILYIIFYVSYKYFAKHAEKIIWAICIIFIITVFFLQIDNPWYGSTLCFPLGLFYY